MCNIFYVKWNFKFRSNKNNVLLMYILGNTLLSSGLGRLSQNSSQCYVMKIIKKKAVKICSQKFTKIIYFSLEKR